MKSTFGSLALAMVLGYSANGLALAEGPPGRARPNVVYILADDLGYGDVKRLNSSSKIATPVLDRFASEGVTCTDAHSGSAVCSPTRYGLLTGRYAWRSKLKRGVLGGYSPPLIEPGRLTVPALLAGQGYATACVGKWHLGMTWPVKEGAAIEGDGYASESRIDFSRAIADGPLSKGFGSFFGISASLDMPPYAFIEGDRVVAPPTARQAKVGYVREGAKDPAFRFDRVLPELTDRSIRFIADRAKQGPGQPFFLYLALNAPHTPIAPSPEFLGKSGVGDYGDFVQEVDASIGRVLKALEDSKVASETLVIVTSDNGPETLAYPRIREYQHYSMGDLRGVKRDAWEGGHRVPFFARWPGQISPGSVSDETICHVDLMATLAAILGVSLPNDAGEDSVNILPALLGKPRDQPIREATVHHTGSGRFSIRQGPLVFIDMPTGDDNGTNNREPEWLKTERHYSPHNQPGELYDLAKDPAERTNLHASRPDDVKRLKALLEKYKAEGRSVPARP
jgi:arylsulfatase A